MLYGNSVAKMCRSLSVRLHVDGRGDDKMLSCFDYSSK